MRRIALLALIACGGTPTALPDIGDRLAALPGVTVREAASPSTEYRAFDLWFQRDGFQQYAALLHRDDDAPLVLYTSGYDAWSTRQLTEPARLLHANQISIETRFYGSSQPVAVDWSQLTALAIAADAHRISEQLAAIYDGPRIATGASKGGEEALIHAWLYPGDLDGVVAYVAAVSTANPDPRYAGVVDAIGPPDCRARLRALQRELLGRRAAIEARAAARDAYTIAGVAHATETAIVELEFAFWMKSGVAFCRYLPDTTASDDALYALLDAISSPAAYSDEALGRYGRAYLYQDQRELGYPVIEHAHLDDLLTFTYEDWSAYLPAPIDRYDPTLPQGLAAWLASGPPHVLLVGGEWDPWRPGYPALGAGLAFLVPHGTHAGSVIATLDDGDRHAALTALDAWAGMPIVQ